MILVQRAGTAVATLTRPDPSRLDGWTVVRVVYKSSTSEMWYS